MARGVNVSLCSKSQWKEQSSQFDALKPQPLGRRGGCAPPIKRAGLVERGTHDLRLFLLAQPDAHEQAHQAPHLRGQQPAYTS